MHPRNSQVSVDVCVHSLIWQKREKCRAVCNNLDIFYAVPADPGK